MYWVCTGKFAKGSGETSVCDHCYLSILFYREGVIFMDRHKNIVIQTLSNNTFNRLNAKLQLWFEIHVTRAARLAER